MKKILFLGAAFVILVCQLAPLNCAQADVVGHLTQVVGRVDVMRSGQLPAIPAKLGDGMQPKDVLRTKSASKARITFMDKSTLAIGPQSKIAIEDYLVDPVQKKRNAVLQLFRGVAQVVVSKIYKVEEPNFVVKTNTAIMGVRGTQFGVQILPNSSTIMNFEGLLQVGNILPVASRLFRRAFAIAYSFGPGAGQWVFLHAMQGTSVGQGQPPGPVFPVTQGMFNSFMQHFSNVGGGGQGQGSSGTSGGSSSGGGGTTGGGSATTFIMDLGTTGTGGADLSGGLGTVTQLPGTNLVIVTIPPTSTPPAPTPTPTPEPSPSPAYYTFIQYLYGYTVVTPASATQAAVNYSTWGFRDATGTTQPADIASGYFTSSVTATRTTDSTSSPFPSSMITEVYQAQMTATVSGTLGQLLTGNFTLTGLTTDTSGANGSTAVNATGTLSLNPDGSLTYNSYAGTFAGLLVSGTETGTETGANTQTPGVFFTQTSSTTTRSTSRPWFRRETIRNNFPISADLLVYEVTGETHLPSRANFVLTNKSSTNFSFSPFNLAAVSNRISGVVSGDPNGVRTGVATIWFGNYYNPDGTYGNRGVYAGPVTITQDYTLDATFYGANAAHLFGYPWASSGSSATQVLFWNQSPQTMPNHGYGFGGGYASGYGSGFGYGAGYSHPSFLGRGAMAAWANRHFMQQYAGRAFGQPRGAMWMHGMGSGHPGGGFLPVNFITRNHPFLHHPGPMTTHFHGPGPGRIGFHPGFRLTNFITNPCVQIPARHIHGPAAHLRRGMVHRPRGPRAGPARAERRQRHRAPGPPHPPACSVPPGFHHHNRPGPPSGAHHHNQQGVPET